MRILAVVGNRPQFVKSGAVSAALATAGIDEVVVHTGQHYDRELSGIFFDELDLAEPDYALDLHTADVEAMERGIAAALRETGPDLLLVYGDTNSTLAGARAGALAEAPVAHVEAGLRSGDLSMPEEQNRIEVDRLSTLLLCPDERSRQILCREGTQGRIEVVGDVMYDVCLRLAPLARRRSKALARLGITPGDYVLATVHREANVARPRLAKIANGLRGIAEGEPVVFPAHPRTRAALEGLSLGAVRLSEPLGYLDFAALASQARVIATDSGGLQKEAYWYGVPCVTMRPSTEWVDTIEAGANVLVDADPDALVAAVAGARMPPERPRLYGDGRASERVAAALLGSLSPA